MDTAFIIFLLLPDTPLFSAGPAKYRLSPMPPPPCSARSPAPHRADFGTILITSSVLLPTVLWGCCWDRNWQFCTEWVSR